MTDAAQERVGEQTNAERHKKAVREWSDDELTRAAKNQAGRLDKAGQFGVADLLYELTRRLRARQREEGNATLADMLERFVEVDANGDKLGWMTSGYNLTCWEAMLEAARRLRARQREEGDVDTRTIGLALNDIRSIVRQDWVWTTELQRHYDLAMDALRVEPPAERETRDDEWPNVPYERQVP